MAKRILIIDDDIELCEELSDLLKSNGYPVDSASIGPDAEEAIKKTKYDVILLDLKLPQLDGISLLKGIFKKNRGSRVFITSGKPFVENLLEEEDLVKEVSGVFSKPFDVEIVLDKIKSLIDLPPSV